MRMFKITTMDDLIKNSMNILEPSPLDAGGNAREDGMNYHETFPCVMYLLRYFIRRQFVYVLPLSHLYSLQCYHPHPLLIFFCCLVSSSSIATFIFVFFLL